AESIRARRGGSIAGLVADLRSARHERSGADSGADRGLAGRERSAAVPGRAAVGSGADPGLDALDADGDPVTSVRAVFSWSYRRLPAEAARVFRLLGLPPGRDLSAPAVAALCGVPEREARRLLDVLVRAHLVEDTADGRYRLHDLLRGYARELAEPGGLAPLRAWYLHTAARAMDVVAPYERHRRPVVPAAAGPVVPLPDEPTAHAWLEAERGNILAGADDPVAVAGVLWRFLDEGGYREDALALHLRALDAATGDDRVEVLNRVGVALFRVWRLDPAVDHLEQALASCRPDHPVLPSVLNNLGLVHSYSGRFAEAVELFERSLDLAPSHQVLSNLGEAYRRLGALEPAVAVLDRAMTAAVAAGDRVAESFTACHRAALDSDLGRHREASAGLERALALSSRSPMVVAEVWYHQGVVSLRTGRVEDAVRHYREACERAGLTGDRRLVAQAHNGLGEAWTATGERDDAVRHFTLALHVATEIGERHEQHRAHAGLTAVSAR
ncbi:MAG: tetratricopeptide repeat protein, partial [Saccharothrix sp.]|nr:tetratricopeptide repeat protein [Saccharothrix sp.]